MANKISFGNKQKRAETLKAFPGIISLVAANLKVSPGTVSRTFHGITKEVNPVIAEALQKAIADAEQAR